MNSPTATRSTSTSRKMRHLRQLTVALTLALPVSALAGQVEPGAGHWRTWVLTSGHQFRPPAPPSGTRAELERLRTLARQRDATTLNNIGYWLAGAPGDRWNELLITATLNHGLNNNRGTRFLALLNVALYDATVAAWDAKYTYRRPRPSQLDPGITSVGPVPDSPAYPSEHAVAAGAASALLAFLFPDEAAKYNALAEQEGNAVLGAGWQYPSDVQVGLDLGRKVAAQVIERASLDRSDAKFTGTVPTGPGLWTGTNPAEAMEGTWVPWVLQRGDQFRPPPPPAPDSQQKKAELAELAALAAQRTSRTNDLANFWQFAVGGTRAFQYFNEQLRMLLAQHGMDSDPPRAARAYALQSVALEDVTIACWDAKYAYWAARPFMLDPNLKPLFTTPNHPSYPAAHGCVSGVNARILGYLFPSEAERYQALAQQAAESRLWAGIHFRSDIVAGLDLARAVGNAVIAWAEQDGSREQQAAAVPPR